jgi:rhamnosyltransferase
VSAERILVVDSESTDGTAELARATGMQVCSIERSRFNHGGTRQMAAELLPDADILVYLTQDAVLAGPEAIAALLAAFEDPGVGAACGRQIPRPQATAIEAHARFFNYPAASTVRSFADCKELGIKAIFLSNSLAAYRRSALMDVGGFPAHVIFGEDTVTAARLLLAGYKIAYVAESCAFHSHPYSEWQEFKRYFDIGVLHSREHWILETFGHASGEGMRFVRSELRFLLRHDVRQIPTALMRTWIKLLAYRLGGMEKHLSPSFKRRISMHSQYWDNAVYEKPAATIYQTPAQ